MADIIDFPQKASNPGNGAREALIDVANTLPTTIERPGDAEKWTDWLLAELWIRDFKVVPLEPADHQ